MPTTGEVVSMDKVGYRFKFDAEMNPVFELELVGEGRCVGTSPDGKWIASGTCE